MLDGYRERGFVFGINTNRPFSEAVSFYDSLKMQGPFIVENGASFMLSRQSSQEIFSNEMVEVNRLIFETLSESDPKAQVVMSGDKSLLNGADDGLLVLITDSRHYTSSVYVRMGGQISREATGDVMELIRDGLGDCIKGVGLSVDGSGGKILAWSTSADRLETLFKIWKTQYHNHDVLVVSDDEPESEGEAPFTFASVFGADGDYARRCQIRTSIGGVDGLRQILEQFSKIQL